MPTSNPLVQRIEGLLKIMRRYRRITDVAAMKLLEEASAELQRASVETSDQPMEFWKSEAIGANTTIRQLKEAIYWALGERDAFPEEPEPLAGKYRRRYHWRTELRRRSGLPISGITAEEPSPVKAISDPDPNERCGYCGVKRSLHNAGGVGSCGNWRPQENGTRDV